MNYDLQTTTVKTRALPKDTELDTAQAAYTRALNVMNASPTDENISAFEKANTELFELQDKYRIGAKLLLQHKIEHFGG